MNSNIFQGLKLYNIQVWSGLFGPLFDTLPDPLFDPFSDSLPLFQFSMEGKMDKVFFSLYPFPQVRISRGGFSVI